MKTKKQSFGVLCDGTDVNLFTISNGKMSVSCTELGATLTSIVLEKKNGKKIDVLFGHSTLDGYIKSTSFFGCIVGRFANRIGNASFTVEGKKYKLDKNDKENTLHGGFDGYHKMIWKGSLIKEDDYVGVKFSRKSPDGEQGMPGNVDLDVYYLLDKNNNLTCYYTATTDKATPINITNHAYFNLAGKGKILNHTLKMNSKYILEVKKGLIPTGKFVNVENTPFDFTTEKSLGKDIQKIKIGGYDHCYVTEKYNPEDKNCGCPIEDSDLVEFCKLKELENEVEMQVFTNMEGCQLYTGNGLHGVTGKNGVKYRKHGAVCLETQCFPDTPNIESFPSCVLQPGQTMKAKTIYSFNF